ncbi:hypothetical protein [Dyadobacter sandarakinus]|uniref:Uncharacterized protein n=1 Tax=Dyadobacter sandarakinus TaxID=2747268 RepID=A0ABX7I2P3_9BACT|nr:hypothetical protein [Dyadobacter sandarakinus]QRR00215.1 hypothetical protein HWI92_04500 [Dyadobacter sandarakinus]
MATIAVSSVLDKLGISSTRKMFEKTGSPEQSLRKQSQIAAINILYNNNKSFRGPLGFPISDVIFEGQKAYRDYAGGQLYFTSDTPQGSEEVTVAQVRFVGFHCNEESDEWSGSDEPYFILSVAGANGSNTIRMGPYSKVNEGEHRFEAVNIISVGDMVTPPVVLGIVAMEQDQGSPEEAEAKVRKVFESIEEKFDAVAGELTGTDTGSHVLPEWSRDILLGWIPEGAAALFGMGDDEIEKTATVLFDNKADLKEWKAPAIIGKHGNNEYNLVLNAGRENEGDYQCFFKVDLFKVTVEIVPFAAS